ncbi:MAG: ABC transporter permease [Desulfobacteraceae bacterium]|nr:MAG: ABC transporter permease [Desulfobacteraceae bacterium]
MVPAVRKTMAKTEDQVCLEERFRKKKRKERLEKTGYFVLSFGILLLVWEFSRAVRIIDPKLFPSIQAVIKACLAGLQNGSLQMHMYASFMRVLTSFAIGIVMAIVFGFLIGWFRVVRLLLDPVINFFRALPPIALIPLMIIFFGIGETSKIVVLSYAAFFPAMVVIYQALVGLDPVYIRAARTLGATSLEIFRKIILPQLVPHIITACRVSLGVCWATLVAAELIAAQKGIGAMMVEAQNFFQMPPLVLGILIIGAISLVMDAAVKAIERKATSWQEKMA